MRIAVVGGAPPAIYRGGLEIQVEETVRALRAVGRVNVAASRGDPLDLVHVIGADPASWNLLRQLPKELPVIVTPVVVFDRVRTPQVEYLLPSRTVFGVTTAGMRRGVIARASGVIALTEEEMRFLSRAYNLRSKVLGVVPNGSSAPRAAHYTGEDAYVVCVGAISERKQQAELAACWDESWPPLRLIGGLHCSSEYADRFLLAVQSAPNITWSGPTDQVEVWNVQARAAATISFSSSEGESLALLDSLRIGRPVLVPRSASSRALHRRYSDGVHIFSAPSDLKKYIEVSINQVIPPASPPSWDEVAQRLVAIYKVVLEERVGADCA